VFRPADGIETAMAWAWIAECAQGPVVLALTRQPLRALEREVPFALEDVWRGAYAVRDPGSETKLVLVATGSEVSLACDAAGKLRAEGLPARVVSVPCLELFLEQSEEYRLGLVPEDGTPVVAVEAARGESFRRLVGRRGLICGIDRFGVSAPQADLAEAFGLTPDGLAARIRRHLRKASS
jgi:transketolase